MKKAKQIVRFIYKLSLISWESFADHQVIVIQVGPTKRKKEYLELLMQHLPLIEESWEETKPYSQTKSAFHMRKTAPTTGTGWSQ